jgi:hypothetical protein
MIAFVVKTNQKGVFRCRTAPGIESTTCWLHSSVIVSNSPIITSVGTVTTALRSTMFQFSSTCRQTEADRARQADRGGSSKAG